MISKTQAAVLVAVVFLLVAGITFVRQVVIPADPGEKGTTPPPVPEQSRLLFAVQVAQPQLGESDKAGWFDYWFQNPQREAVQLTLNKTNCVCSNVRVGFLPAKEGDRFRAEAAALEAAQGLASPRGFVAWTYLSIMGSIETRLPWTPLEPQLASKERPKGEGGSSVTVPPAEDEKHPTFGVVRLGWNGRGKQGPQELTAELLDDIGYAYDLTAPVLFVGPLSIYPPALHVPPLQAGTPGKETVELFCWSPTRYHFDLKANEKNGHPCFVVRTTPLPGPEMRTIVAGFQKELDPTGAKEAPPPPLCGYRVSVDVYEERGGRRLDLGQFRHKIELRVADEEKPYAVTITGSVEGDVKLMAEKNKVDFGFFNASEGAKKDVVLESSQPGARLALDGHKPDYLVVGLRKVEKPSSLDGRSRWDLHVEVPPNRRAGPLPPESEVVLRIEGSGPPRGVRIPVAGNARAR